MDKWMAGQKHRWLLFALLLAYILNPVVNWIQRARIARAPAIALLFLVFYGLLIGTGVATVPAFFRQLGDLYEASVGDTGAIRCRFIPQSSANSSYSALLRTTTLSRSRSASTSSFIDSG